MPRLIINQIDHFAGVGKMVPAFAVEHVLMENQNEKDFARDSTVHFVGRNGSQSSANLDKRRSASCAVR